MAKPKDFEPISGSGSEKLLFTKPPLTPPSITEAMQRFELGPRVSLANDVRAVISGQPLRPESPLNTSYDPKSKEKPVHSEVTGLDYPNTPYGRLRMKAEETRKAFDAVLSYEELQALASVRALVLTDVLTNPLPITDRLTTITEGQKNNNIIKVQSFITGRFYPNTPEGLEQMRREEAKADEKHFRSSDWIDPLCSPKRETDIYVDRRSHDDLINKIAPSDYKISLKNPNY